MELVPVRECCRKRAVSVFCSVVWAESWWREGRESSVGGLDGGLWWFSDGDETESQAGLTMMD